MEIPTSTEKNTSRETLHVRDEGALGHHDVQKISPKNTCLSLLTLVSATSLVVVSILGLQGVIQGSTLTITMTSLGFGIAGLKMIDLCSSHGKKGFFAVLVLTSAAAVGSLGAAHLTGIVGATVGPIQTIHVFLGLSGATLSFVVLTRLMHLKKPIEFK